MREMNNQLSFGTDGIRGKVGIFPFTPHDMERLGAALGAWRMGKKVDEPFVIMIGSDTRASCEFIKKALIAGLSGTQVQIIDVGVVAIPVLLWALNNDEKADCAIMISASHNPASDNGIKILARKTGSISSSDEQLIAQHFESIAKHPQIHTFSFSKNNHPYPACPECFVSLNEQNVSKGEREKITLNGQPFDTFCVAKHSGNAGERMGPLVPANPQITIDSTATERYEQALLAQCIPNFLAGKIIALDCANGSLSTFSPAFFEKLGARVVATGTCPDGNNINEHCGSTHPESIINLVKQHHADIGFAFDGDGDRIVAVNQNGDLKDGDDILALLTIHPDYAQQPAVVATVVSNEGLNAFVQNKGMALVRAGVGEKHIIKQLIELDLNLGGEPSGHIIIKSHLVRSDGLFVALQLLKIAQLTNNWNLNSFEKYPSVSVNFHVTSRIPLENEPLKTIIAAYQEQVPHGTIVIRYSGTEPLMRIVVQDKNLHHATQVAQDIEASLKKVLS